MSITNAQKFNDANSLFVENASETILRTVRALTIQAYGELIRESPVDTGRFRSNWMVGLGTANEQTTASNTPNYGEATSGIKGLGERESKVFITNSLPYAERLENGHSSQNQGFCKRVAKRLDSRLKTVGLNVDYRTNA